MEPRTKTCGSYPWGILLTERLSPSEASRPESTVTILRLGKFAAGFKKSTCTRVKVDRTRTTISTSKAGDKPNWGGSAIYFHPTTSRPQVQAQSQGLPCLTFRHGAGMSAYTLGANQRCPPPTASRSRLEPKSQTPIVFRVTFQGFHFWGPMQGNFSGISQGAPPPHPALDAQKALDELTS